MSMTPWCVVATVLGLLWCDVVHAMAPWKIGNTNPIPATAPSGHTTSTTIPNMHEAVRQEFLGPMSHPKMWLNETHLMDTLDVGLLSMARYFVFRHRERQPDSHRIEGGRYQLVERHSWVLCYAKDGLKGAHRIEVGEACDAFRTRRGPIALSVATVHEITLAHYPAKPSPTPVGTMTLAIMEDTQQIYHPQETSNRIAFVQALINDWVEGCIDRDVLTWDIATADRTLHRLLVQDNMASKLSAGIRGLSLLAMEDHHSNQPTYQRINRIHRIDPCEPAEVVDPVCNSVRKDASPQLNRQFQFGVATQNIWNFNGDWRLRRNSLCSDMLGIHFPVHIMTLQEVRQHSDAPNDVSSTTFGAVSTEKCQANDFVSALTSSIPVASFRYFPAMAYLHLSNYQPPRIELEGLMHAMLSQALGSAHLVGHVRTLLSRNTADSGDDHQRQVLCSVLMMESEGGDLVRLDVCSSHFALGATAQLNNAIESIQFMSELATTSTVADRSVRPADFTFFTGDLNSEPHHEVASTLIASGFRDLWLECPGTEGDGFTFNTNDEQLTKRIDFIYAKAHHGSTVVCNEAKLLGTMAAVGSVSSDHLGLAVSLTINAASIQ